MIFILHLGDITKINGAKVPIVNVITGGSPCQDLSVAGKRAGLEGERSGLFMEQMRIVKEMREASKQKLISEFGENYDKSRVAPRYMVWENVCLLGTSLIDCIDGIKQIKDVQVGDQVLTHNHRYMPVVETYVHTDKEVVQVNIIGEQPLICTPNHPIYGCKKNPDGSYGELEFIPAGLLTSEHRVASFWNDKIAYKAIESVVPLDKKETVYNLSVLEDNTYVANGIICHNCGAYSSGNPAGSDFAAVLEEITRVVVAEVPTIHVPEQGWSYSGCFEGMGDERMPFSICWRTHDAQYWGKTILDNSGRVVKAGTPQRRRRIALVADFGGNTAPEILFECESMSGNTKSSREEREATSGTTGEGITESGTNGITTVEDTPKTYKKDSHAKSSEDGQGWIEAEVNDTLNVFDQGDARTPTLVVDNAPNTIAIEGNGSRESHQGDGYKKSDVMYTLNTIEQHAVCIEEPVAIESHPQDSRVKLNTDDVNQPITANMEHDPANGGLVLQKTSEPICMGSSQANAFISTDGTSATLLADASKQSMPMIVDNQEPILLESSQDHATVQTSGVSTTLPASMGEGGGYVPMVVEGCDVYNHEVTGEVAATVTAACGGSNTSDPKVLMQGFDSYNQAPTGEVAKPLTNKATDSDHIPVVYGFEPGAAKRLDPENRFNEELSPTLRAEMGDNQAAVVYGIDQQGGKGTAAYSENVAPTMASDSHGTPHAVCYGMSALDSNAMKSSNPHSGIYEADTSRTLDLNGGNPACNQGGMMVVEHKSELTDAEKEQVEDWVSAVNSSAKHQQDLIQSDLGVAHTIAPGTHASGPHLTKTLVTSAVSDRPVKESVKSYGVTTKGNGDAFIAEERHTALSTGGGEPGQGYPCVLTEQIEPDGCLNPWDVQSKHIQPEDGVAESLYSGECRYGGGESYVMQNSTYQDTTGALCAAGYSKLGTQEASNDMYVVQESTADVITMTDCGFQDIDQSGVAFTLRARDYKAPQTIAVDMGGGKSGCGISEEQSPTLTTTHGGEPVVFGFKPDQGSKAQGMGFEEEKAPTLNTSNNAGVLSIENHPNDSRVKIRDDGTVQTLSGRMGTGGNNTPMVMETNPQAFSQNQREECRELGDTAGAVSAEPGTHQQTFISKPVVRRLTPLECTRLQGFPDGWVDIGDWVDSNGKLHKDSDSAKYKALGNSIALPFWDWMSGRMCEQLRKSGVENPTMASLFDGISGFPLVYAKHNCTPIWSSEIEEFPIAVCKKHFGDDATGEMGDYEQYLHPTAPFYMTNSNKVYGLDRASFNQGKNALYDFSVEEDKAQTLVSRGPGGVMTELSAPSVLPITKE